METMRIPVAITLSFNWIHGDPNCSAGVMTTLLIQPGSWKLPVQWFIWGQGAPTGQDPSRRTQVGVHHFLPLAPVQCEVHSPESNAQPPKGLFPPPFLGYAQAPQPVSCCSLTLENSHCQSSLTEVLTLHPSLPQVLPAPGSLLRPLF